MFHFFFRLRLFGQLVELVQVVKAKFDQLVQASKAKHGNLVHVFQPFKNKRVQVGQLKPFKNKLVQSACSACSVKVKRGQLFQPFKTKPVQTACSVF